MKKTEKMKQSIASLLAAVIMMSAPSSNRNVEYVNDYSLTTISNIDETKVASIGAHRGFSSKEIENSKPAIISAISADYIDMVEIDIRMTKDKVLVLSHDENLYNTTGINVNVSDLTYEELNQLIFRVSKNDSSLTNINGISDLGILTRYLDLFFKKSEVLKLDEVLDLFNYLNKKLCLHLYPSNNNVEMSDELQKLLEQYQNNNLMIQESDPSYLDYLKVQIPNAEYGVLIHNKSELAYLTYDFDFYTIEQTLIDEELLEILEPGKTFLIWTLNNKKDYQRIIALADKYHDKFDFVLMTDYPDLVKNQLNKEESSKRLTLV